MQFNLHIISPNQDDLSYSAQISFPGSRNWVSCQTPFLWLNNAVQCRHPTGRSSIAAAAAWTHEGNLSNLWIPCIYHLDQGIPVEYELDTFNTPHTGTTLCHPQNWLCRCDALFRSRHLALISPLGHFNGDNARLSPNPPDAQNWRWLQSLFPPTANKTFAKLRRTPSLARLTIRAAFSTFS